jgi:putative DNA methylase
MARDELHKTLRGTGVAQDDLTVRGWIKVTGTTVHVTVIPERMAYFVAPGRNRKVLKSDLDQAQFLIGAALPNSGINVTVELNRDTFRLKRSVDAILDWYERMDPASETRAAAALALKLVSLWRTQPQPAAKPAQYSLFEQLDFEEA